MPCGRVAAAALELCTAERAGVVAAVQRWRLQDGKGSRVQGVAGRFKGGAGDLGVRVWKAGGEIRGGEGGRGGAEIAGVGRNEEERK